MFEITPNMLVALFSIGAALIFSLLVLVNVFTLWSLRCASKERQALNREVYGLVKKLEGLTSSRREQMLKHYDGLLEVLSTRLPTAVANQTSQLIFDTESKILARLAELEPSANQDEKSKKKLDDLIKSMEGLEHTIVALTSDAVRSVMVEGRRSLFEGDSDLDIKLAA